MAKNWEWEWNSVNGNDWVGIICINILQDGARKISFSCLISGFMVDRTIVTGSYNGLYCARSVVSLGSYSQPERSEDYTDYTLILSSGLHTSKVHIKDSSWSLPAANFHASTNYKSMTNRQGQCRSREFETTKEKGRLGPSEARKSKLSSEENGCRMPPHRLKRWRPTAFSRWQGVLSCWGQS